VKSPVSDDRNEPMVAACPDDLRGTARQTGMKDGMAASFDHLGEQAPMTGMRIALRGRDRDGG
jgi:hypothetical protein